MVDIRIKLAILFGAFAIGGGCGGAGTKHVEGPRPRAVVVDLDAANPAAEEGGENGKLIARDASGERVHVTKFRPPNPESGDGGSQADSGADGAFAVEGMLGRIDMDRVHAAFSEASSDVAECHQKNIGRYWYIGGQIEVNIRVARDGKVVRATPVKSTIGQFEVERCVVRQLAGLNYGKPVGGEAEFTLPVVFDARAATAFWSDAKTATQLGSLPKKVAGCLSAEHAQDGGGVVVFTLYISPGGNVTGVGLASENPISESASRCAVNKVSSTRVGDTNGQIIKATFSVPLAP